MPSRFRLPSQDCANVFGLAAEAAVLGFFGSRTMPNLVAMHDSVALASDGPSYQFFVDVRAVDVGGIEKIDAEFEGAVDGGERFGVVASAVEFRHAHAAQAHGGDR